jgi:hypothetical protein
MKKLIEKSGIVTRLNELELSAQGSNRGDVHPCSLLKVFG